MSQISSKREGMAMDGINVPGNVFCRLHLTFGNHRGSVCWSIHRHRCRCCCGLSLLCSRLWLLSLQAKKGNKYQQISTKLWPWGYYNLSWSLRYIQAHPDTFRYYQNGKSWHILYVFFWYAGLHIISHPWISLDDLGSLVLILGTTRPSVCCCRLNLHCSRLRLLGCNFCRRSFRLQAGRKQILRKKIKHNLACENIWKKHNLSKTVRIFQEVSTSINIYKFEGYAGHELPWIVGPPSPDLWHQL